MMAAEPATSRLAPAKVNLTLHLRGQRADGYHLLESIAVFPSIGDVLHAADGQGIDLSVTGPFAEGLTGGGDNLVLRAAEALARHAGGVRGAKLRLEKNLPVASGIGGGSSDAAAALVLLAERWGCSIPDGLALSLGADVPVCCRAPEPQRMQGIGEILSPMPAMPPFWIVLVNPLVAVPTGAVFAGVADKCPPAAPDLPGGGFRDFPALVAWLKTQRNDLQDAAIAQCPAIGEVLGALSSAPLARMSGSGATCFAMLPDEAEATALAARLRMARNWWVVAAPVPTQ